MSVFSENNYLFLPSKTGKTPKNQEKLIFYEGITAIPKICGVS